MSVPGTGAVRGLGEIRRTLAEDLARLDEEAAEIELLVQQIRARSPTRLSAWDRWSRSCGTRA